MNLYKLPDGNIVNLESITAVGKHYKIHTKAGFFRPKVISTRTMYKIYTGGWALEVEEELLPRESFLHTLELL